MRVDLRWRLQGKKIAELHEVQFALNEKEKETRMCTCVCEKEREKESEIRVGDEKMTRVKESARVRERGWVGDVQYTREREREKERSRHS